MDKKTIQAVKTLNKELKNAFSGFEGAYVYASRANGTSQIESDIDIVAVFKNEINREKRMDIWGIVGKIEAELDIFLDLHPMTREELERNPIFYDEVVNKGIFYEAA